MQRIQHVLPVHAYITSYLVHTIWQKHKPSTIERKRCWWWWWWSHQQRTTRAETVHMRFCMHTLSHATCAYVFPIKQSCTVAQVTQRTHNQASHRLSWCINMHSRSRFYAHRNARPVCSVICQHPLHITTTHRRIRRANVANCGGRTK